MNAWMAWPWSKRFRSKPGLGRGVFSSRALRFEKLEARQLLRGTADFGLPMAEGEPAVRPDFSLTDVNSASPTSQQAVSPRDYLEQVSGWFFAYGL